MIIVRWAATIRSFVCKKWRSNILCESFNFVYKGPTFRYPVLWERQGLSAYLDCITYFSTVDKIIFAFIQKTAFFLWNWRDCLNLKVKHCLK